jgi:hypothetical protein
MLAGAVVGASSGELRLAMNGSSASPVLVIEGALNTGVQLGRAMLMAQSAGSPKIVGGVVVADSRALADIRGVFGQIFALEERS